MKLNKIMLFFYTALSVSVVLRFLQLYFTVDPKTGFFLIENEAFGYILLTIILLCVLLVAIFSYMVFRQPDNLPKGNIFTTISSLTLSGAVLFEMLTQKITLTTVIWQLAVLRICSVATAIFFIFYAICPIIKIRIPKIATIVPVTYLIIKIIFDFTSISKLALISDNIILIAVYCVCLLFFLNFAKLYNDTDEEKCFKYVLCSGLSAIVLSFTNSIPNILINIISKNSYMHISMSSNITILFLGMFILSFLISYFCKKKN